MGITIPVTNTTSTTKARHADITKPQKEILLFNTANAEKVKEANEKRKEELEAKKIELEEQLEIYKKDRETGSIDGLTRNIVRKTLYKSMELGAFCAHRTGALGLIVGHALGGTLGLSTSYKSKDEYHQSLDKRIRDLEKQINDINQEINHLKL